MLRFWTLRLQHSRASCGNATDTVLLLAHDPRRLTEAAALDAPPRCSRGRPTAVRSCSRASGALALPPLSRARAGLGLGDKHVDFREPGNRDRYVRWRINCPPEVALITLKAALTDSDESTAVDSPSTLQNQSARPADTPGAPRAGIRVGRASSGVSPSSTGTVRCRTIGPPSSSAVTQVHRHAADLGAMLDGLTLRV